MQHVLHALSMAFAMFWEILWALILGFGLSAVVQAVVGKEQMTKLLPDDSPKSLAIACGLGAASSSCSYAAAALARSLFRKGANFTAAMAFMLASTNLVAELGIIMAILLGWQFTLAEFAGGMERHRRRIADRRRARRMGPGDVVESFLSHQSPAAGAVVGAGGGADRGDSVVRLLDWKRAAGSHPLERRQQLRRRGRLH